MNFWNFICIKRFNHKSQYGSMPETMKQNIQRNDALLAHCAFIGVSYSRFTLVRPL